MGTSAGSHWIIQFVILTPWKNVGKVLREINLSTWLRLELTVLEELADWS